MQETCFAQAETGGKIYPLELDDKATYSHQLSPTPNGQEFKMSSEAARRQENETGIGGYETGFAMCQKH